MALVDLPLDSSWTVSGTEFGDLIDLTVGPDGRVYLLDRLATRVVVLGPDGRFAFTFGREGDGPGEFSAQSLTDLMVADSAVLVPDLQRQRVLEYGMDGTYTASHEFPVQGYALEWTVGPGGAFLHRMFDLGEDNLVRWRPGGGADTLFAFEPLRAPPTELLPPAPLWVVDGDVLVVGRSNDPELRRIVDGRTHTVIRLGGEARDLADREKERLDSILMGFVRQSDPGAISQQILSRITYPEKAPVLSGLLRSPRGEIWVRRAGTADEMGSEALRVGTAMGYGGTEWVVLDASGLAARRVRVPRGFAPREFRGRWLYGILTDELGVQRPARVAWE